MTPDHEKAALSVVDTLVQTSFTVTAVLSRKAAEHDMSLTQLRVLAILRDRAPLMAELATYLGLERSSMSGLIDRAVGRGLVRREGSSEDRRSVRVSLTAEGQQLAAAVTDEIADLLAPLTGRLKVAEQKRLVELLTTMLGPQ